MSEKRDRDFSRYEAMETEELEEILRLDAEAPEERESDTELLLYIMEVLANRNKNNITGKTAQESWESFQKNYLGEECTEDKQEPQKCRITLPWLRRAIAAAAVIALLICIPVTARAFGWGDIWNIIARWAGETFSFVSVDNTDVTEPDMVYNSEIASLRELLEGSNQDGSIVPTWIPEGFVLEKIERDATPTQVVYRALYTNGNKVLKIRVQHYLATDIYNFEIGADFSEVYTIFGTDYYIFDNNEQLQIVWVTDPYECMISGDISIEVAKEMINSIEKG